MTRLPPISTRTRTLFPYTTRFRSLRHVARPHRLALHVGHHDGGELRGRLQVGGRYHREFPVARFDPAGGDFDVLAGQRGLDVLHRAVEGRQLVAVDIAAHGRHPFAVHAHLVRAPDPHSAV